MLKSSYSIKCLLSFITLVIFMQGAAQNNSASILENKQRVLADKIVVFVGDKYVLYSDIQNYLADFKRQAQAANIEDITIPDPCQVLENLMIKKIFVLQAQRDSLPLSEDEVDAALENRIRSYIYQYGSKEVLEEVANRSIFQIKEDFREPIREQKLSELMQNKIIEVIKVTPVEVSDYYNKINKDSLLVYESEVELNQLVVHPNADPDVESYVIKQLNDYKRQVETGVKNFDYFVKQYSEDPGSRENFGQYTLNRGDKNWDPNFFSAAFRLKTPGQVTPVIRSKFGFHIIQLVKKGGDEVVVKHVLRTPPITEAETKIIKNKLDSIRKEIIQKKMSFNEAVNKYSDDENSKFTAGAILDRNTGASFITIDALDKDLVLAIKGLNPGDVTVPLEFTDERGRKGLRLVYFKSRTTPHKENLKDDYNKVAQRVLDLKKQVAIENWIKNHIQDFYVLIVEPYKSCPQLAKWFQSQN